MFIFLNHFIPRYFYEYSTDIPGNISCFGIRIQKASFTRECEVELSPGISAASISSALIPSFTYQEHMNMRWLIHFGHVIISVSDFLFQKMIIIHLLNNFNIRVLDTFYTIPVKVQMLFPQR